MRLRSALLIGGSLLAAPALAQAPVLGPAGTQGGGRAPSGESGR